MKRRLLYLVLLAACAPPPPVPLSTPAPTFAIATATPTASPAPALGIGEKFLLRDLAGTGRFPIDAAILDGKVYVLNAETANVAVIQNSRAVKFIPVGKQPTALAADSANTRLYVSNSGDKSIALIVNDQITRAQDIGAEARALLFSENRLWVGLGDSGTILVLDAATLQIQSRLSIPNAFSVIALASDAANHRVYANAFEKTTVIDTANLRVLNTLITKGSYYALAAHAPTHSALVAVYESNAQTQYLLALDPQTGAERGRARLGGDPRGIAVSRDGARVYVANSFTNAVSVIDPRAMSTLTTIRVGLKPYALALDEDARLLYVTNYESDSVSVVATDTHQIAATIPLAMMPTALEVNESARRVYIANASSDSVLVVEGARVVKEIGVGRHPIDLARDAQSNRLLVANQADGTISIIDERDFSVRATEPIARVLTTVAVDAPRARVLANDNILNLDTLTPSGKLTLRGTTIGSNIVPDFVRVDAAANRIYALGGNGVPGSNARRVLYSVDGATLQQRALLGVNGNTDWIALDADSNRVYGAGTHPLAFTHDFGAWDLSDSKVFAMPLAARTTGMAYNPQTRHLFLAHAASPASFGAPTPNPSDNTVQVLDTTTFGQVARLSMQSPGTMARFGNFIYVTNRDDGSVTIVQDASVPAPPAPAPTATRTPFATLTPARMPTR